MRAGWYGIVIAGAALLCGPVGAREAACVDDPAYEAQLARQDGEQLQELQHRYGAYTVSERTRRIFERLRSTLSEGVGGAAWRLVGYRAAAINAHAGHDGTIVVSAGLDSATLPEHVIAAAMAHEIAHVLLRHGMARACLALQLMTPALSSAGPQDDPGVQVRRLMHEQELQADALAIGLLRSAGYPRHALSELLIRLAPQASRASTGSHPDHALRLGRAIEAESAQP